MYAVRSVASIRRSIVSALMWDAPYCRAWQQKRCNQVSNSQRTAGCAEVSSGRWQHTSKHTTGTHTHTHTCTHTQRIVPKLTKRTWCCTHTTGLSACMCVCVCVCVSICDTVADGFAPSPSHRLLATSFRSRLGHGLCKTVSACLCRRPAGMAFTWRKGCLHAC